MGRRVSDHTDGAESWVGRLRWELLGPGTALVGYGWFFFSDLGPIAYAVIALGLALPTIGPALWRWCGGSIDTRVEPWELDPPELSPPVALARAWRHFALSVAGTTALSAFSFWRVQMTVWRPIGERYYLFPTDTWMGRLEHSWLNDALYAFGMVAILYLLYTLKEFLGSRFASRADPLFGDPQFTLSEEVWNDHQDRAKLMIGTGVMIILVWAWLEEIGDLVPGYVFDKWDINAIYLGFILGYSMMHHLSYPVFAVPPYFWLRPAPRSRLLGDLFRFLYVAFVWAYTAFSDPSTYGDRWSHLAELSAIILGSMWLLDLRQRGSRAPVGVQLG